MNNLLQPVYPDLPADGLPPCRPPADAADYLTDESRLQGQADRVYFPRSETEILSLLRAANDSRTPLTIAGGRTGITGGSVPLSGWLASLEGMRQFTGLRRGQNDTWLLRCQPGVTLSAINEALAARDFPGAEWSAEDQQALKDFRSAPPCWFPPDPTEQTACLGGMAACNASGARTLFFGPTRSHIAGLRVALAD
ncbi:MAG: FAD-binding oxidoreductase, partial [Lentisphaerae bacterium]|nr:FAD-binding oxidoreductase [Lentisphaerota bacterium]